MVNADNPWSLRGGKHENGANAGTFAFNHWNGIGYFDSSFRQKKITDENK